MVLSMSKAGKCVIRWQASIMKTFCFQLPESRGLFSAPGLPQKSLMFQVYHIDPDGGAANYEVPKVTFYNELGLSARDLRFQHSFMMTARNSKMIIRIQDLKAIICQNALLLIDANSSNSNHNHEQFYNDLPLILAENKLHSKHLPFEYKVLEIILSHSIDTMKAVMEELEPEIIQLLDTLTNPTNMDIDQALVHVLLEYTVKLNKFSTGIREFCQMLDDLLEVEEDLRDMCISVEPGNHIEPIVV